MSINNKTVCCLGYSIYNGDLDNLLSSKQVIINTLNQYSYCIAEKDLDFKKSLKNANILLPDGIGIVLAAKFLQGNKIKKIAGADLHLYLLKELNKKEGRCFYLGSTQKTIDNIKKRINNEYLNINVAGYSPPFKKEFSIDDNLKIIREINAFKPDVLFVGMTAPKQEKWVEFQKESLETKMICSIGAVFDFYAETKKRPGKIWIQWGLEWFGRLLQEPVRMWKRYLYYGVVFGFYLLKEKVKIVFNR